MITLRYHIITIVSVFLSLGLGIILGGSIGQNWINEKQQALLVGLEEKYDQAVKSNQQLEKQINELSVRIDEANREFSTFVSSDYLPDLQGKQVGVWYPVGTDTEQIIDLLRSVGLQVVDMSWNSDWSEQQIPTYPVLLTGDIIPYWASQLAAGSWIQVSSLVSTPVDQWKLLRNIQLLYKENDHEY